MMAMKIKAKKKMTYLEQLNETRLQYNNSRLNKGDGKAWDNRKSKGAKRYDPRGKVIKRMRQIERTAWWNKAQLDKSL